MKNWSTDTKELEQDQLAMTAWRLEQLVNFGLGGTKISLSQLRKFWDKLSIDPMKKRFLALFV